MRVVPADAVLSAIMGARKTLRRVLSSRVALPLRPASSGPSRYWQDRGRLAVKGAIAAVAAWALAAYAAGQPDPYFAPLAALLGVYPTVARSVRESIRYLGGFLLGVHLQSRPASCWDQGCPASPLSS